MLRLLDERADGCRLFALGSIDDLDFPRFLPMVGRAWQHDYAGEPRLDFDEAYFRRIAADPWWVAVLAVGPDGAPVGFELALERTLRVRDRVLRAFYASVFTVSADHRRRGLGRWVLEGINRLVFAERGADLIVSTFHQGHAGSPAVQSTFDRIPGWGVVRFHQSPMWSRRLDRDPIARSEGTPPVVRLGESALPGSREGAAIDELLRDSFETSFALSESLAAQYLDAGSAHSGLYRYELGAGRFCIAGWNILPIARDERRLQPVGQLQLLAAPECAAAEIETIVRHLAADLADRGCFAVTLLDTGVVAAAVLERLGFAAGDLQIAFAARGPRSTIEAFEGVRPPFFLDFT